MAGFSIWDISNCNCPSCVLDDAPNTLFVTDFNIAGHPTITVTRPGMGSDWTGTYSFAYPGCAGCPARTVTLTYTIFLHAGIHGPAGTLQISYNEDIVQCPNDAGLPVLITSDSVSFTCTPGFLFTWGLAASPAPSADGLYTCGGSGPYSWTGSQ